MQETAGTFRLREEPDKIDGIAGEHIAVRNIQPVVVDAEICALPELPALHPTRCLEKAANAWGRFQLLHLECAAENRRQVADIFCNQKIVLHEALDRPHTAALGILKAAGKGGLQIEGHDFFGAASQEMQGAAHAP